CSSDLSLMVDAADAMEAEAALPRILEFVAENRGKVPLVYSSADPEAVTAAQERHGREALAILFERFFADLALAAIEMGFRRIVVAGGETSGAVARSEEHTSELQSRENLVCRLLLEETKS